MAVAALRAALESERNSLQEIDASIKRIVQAPVPRHNHHDRFNNVGEMGRGGAGRGAGGPGARGEYAEGRPDELGKRRYETKTVFSRLSVRHDGDSDHEDNGLFGKKPRVSSQVTRDLPSKQEIMKAQCGDEQSKVRNRRMFGSLLGTLQKFKQEEIVLKSKEDKKAQVERRIEEQAQLEREKQRRERQTLFADRELKKATIKALEAKVARAGEFDAWAAGQSPLGNFILTRARPHIFWLPRRIDPRADEKLSASRKHHHKYMEKKRQELEEELVRIEQKCLRAARTPQNVIQSAASKENKMDVRPDGEDSETEQVSPKKREKFISEARVKEENGTNIKSEEDRDRRHSKRERTISKEQTNNDEKETIQSERSKRESGEREESRSSEGQRPERERRESEREPAAAAQNGSPSNSPAPQERSEEVPTNSQLGSKEEEGGRGESPAPRSEGAEHPVVGDDSNA